MTESETPDVILTPPLHAENPDEYPRKFLYRQKLEPRTAFLSQTVYRIFVFTHFSKNPVKRTKKADFDIKLYLTVIQGNSAYFEGIRKPLRYVMSVYNNAGLSSKGSEGGDRNF